MLATPFRRELEESGQIIPLVFRSFEVELKAFSPEIVEDMVEENRVVSQYSQLMAGMEFEFRGEKLPRPMLMKYAKSPTGPPAGGLCGPGENPPGPQRPTGRPV